MRSWRMAHAAGDDTLKIGLIGCGGRGTGAVGNAFAADPNTKLVAIADTFADRANSAPHANRQGKLGAAWPCQTTTCSSASMLFKSCWLPM